MRKPDRTKNRSTPSQPPTRWPGVEEDHGRHGRAAQAVEREGCGAARHGPAWPGRGVGCCRPLHSVPLELTSVSRREKHNGGRRRRLRPRERRRNRRERARVNRGAGRLGRRAVVRAPGGEPPRPARPRRAVARRGRGLRRQRACASCRPTCGPASPPSRSRSVPGRRCSGPGPARPRDASTVRWSGADQPDRRRPPVRPPARSRSSSSPRTS